MWITRGPKQAASRISLRLKLTLWMVGISAVLQLTLALVVTFYQRSTVGGFLVERLKVRADSVAEAVRKYDFQVTDADLSRIAGDNIRQTLYPRLLITVFNGDGSVVASNLRPAPTPESVGVPGVRFGPSVVVQRNLTALNDPAEKKSNGQHIVLKRVKAATGEDYVVLMGTTDVYYDTLLGLTGQVIGLTAAIGVAAAGIAAWIIAGLATAPLKELRSLAGSLSPDGIDREVPASASSSLSSQELSTLRHEVQEARAKLREALHAQDRFISSVSHELKTPIAVLLTEAQTVDARGVNGDTRKFIQSVTDEMRRLGRMVESFLMLTKVRGGMSVVDAKIYGVNDLVIEAVQSCGKSARQYNVTLAPELADGENPPTVSGDAELLRVLMDNLIQNAIRFSPEKQRVVIRVIQGESDCTVSVRDFGPGVPDDIKDKLFERFVQGPGQGQRGHGLGLSIAQGIAELHGGRITVRNVPDGGCEFAVRLPLAPQPRRDPVPAQVAEPDDKKEIVRT